jgi:hypothetical protein
MDNKSVFTFVLPESHPVKSRGPIRLLTHPANFPVLRLNIQPHQAESLLEGSQ